MPRLNDEEFPQTRVFGVLLLRQPIWIVAIGFVVAIAIQVRHYLTDKGLQRWAGLKGKGGSLLLWRDAYTEGDVVIGNCMEVSVEVPYSVDTDQALQIMQQIFEEMAREPVWQARLSEAPSILGIDSFTPTGVRLALYAKTPPFEQWGAARLAD